MLRSDSQQGVATPGRHCHDTVQLVGARRAAARRGVEGDGNGRLELEGDGGPLGRVHNSLEAHLLQAEIARKGPVGA
eukprot:14452556-Alexandrium_andersonii.AAC.1